jgi:hypothetical protein
MCFHMTFVFRPVLAAALLLDVTAASAADRTPSMQSNRTTPGALGQSRQSLKPTPGQIRGLGSRSPEIGVAPGTPGGPTYYPKAMRPIEPE